MNKKGFIYNIALTLVGILFIVMGAIVLVVGTLSADSVSEKKITPLHEEYTTLDIAIQLSRTPLQISDDEFTTSFSKALIEYFYLEELDHRSEPQQDRLEYVLSALKRTTQEIDAVGDEQYVITASLYFEENKLSVVELSDLQSSFSHNEHNSILLAYNTSSVSKKKVIYLQADIYDASAKGFSSRPSLIGAKI